MPVMEKLRMFVAQEPVVAASCLIAGIGLFLPAVVRPILDSLEGSKHVPEKQPSISDEYLQNKEKKHKRKIFLDAAISSLSGTWNPCKVLAGMTGKRQG